MGKGRKRKQGKREANGRIQRPTHSQLEQENMRPAMEYRERVLGVPPKLVRDQKAATLIGRLCLSGAISEAQWQAGEDWHSLMEAMYAAANAPRGFKTGGNGSGVELGEDEEARRYRSLKAKFGAANLAVEDRAPVAERIERFKALRLFIVDQVDQPSMHGTLRAALNGLAHHFGHERRKAA